MPYKYKVLQTAFMYKCTNISMGCTLCIHACMYVCMYACTQKVCFAGLGQGHVHHQNICITAKTFYVSQLDPVQKLSIKGLSGTQNERAQ